MENTARCHPRRRRPGGNRRAAGLRRLSPPIAKSAPPCSRRSPRGSKAWAKACWRQAHEESALPLARLQGERGRTTAQLRLFAPVVREGAYLGVRRDAADPGRQPLPRPELRRILRPLGPVAVFGASNFPLAFSVAGGDTAVGPGRRLSGDPQGAPRPSEDRRAWPAARSPRPSREVGLPAGVFTPAVRRQGHQVGQWLASPSGIQAIAFTGSLRGGRALSIWPRGRPRPIPVYAEMGSVNPVFLLPGALVERTVRAIAAGLAGSVTMGVGQFCTNPGLVFLVAGEGGESPAGSAGREARRRAGSGTMLYLALVRQLPGRARPPHRGARRRSAAANPAPAAPARCSRCC